MTLREVDHVSFFAQHGLKFFAGGVGTWIIERVDRKLMSRGLISYRRLVVSCSKMALDGSIIVEICNETMAKNVAQTSRNVGFICLHVVHFRSF